MTATSLRSDSGDMKVFWSWQADTHGKTGRHFVKSCLADAITAVVQATVDVDEPDREESRAIELDQDRMGVVGHPGLADTIFAKIAAAWVFVADVTLVAELKGESTEDNPDGIKKLVNSNVAIEYGYAVGNLTDAAILLVMNTYYGPRAKLPFDLSHKVAPCRYRLAPDATASEIAAERKSLSRQFADALRLHLKRLAAEAPPPREPPVVPFHATSSTAVKAFFWKRGEVLARFEAPFRPSEDDTVEYTFSEQRAFYLRLMPLAELPARLDITRLTSIVERRRLAVMTRTVGGMAYGRNQYGAIAYEPHGTSKTPLALTQLFRNGEIWGVSREFAVHYENRPTIPMINLQNLLTKGLRNFIEVAREELAITPPYNVEIGAVGLDGVCVSLPPPVSPFSNKVSEPIFDHELVFNSELKAVTPQAQQALIMEFIRKLYDLANVAFQAPA